MKREFHRTNGGGTMAGYQYSGKIDHTEKTITALYRAQYHAYEKPQMLLWMGIGFVMVLIAALTNIPLWAKGILLLVGAWLIISMDFPSQIRADRALEARNGSLPSMQYEFHKDRIRVSGEGSMSIPYKKIVRLAEDKEYFYLFMGKDSICMVDRSSIKHKSADKFKQFMTNKTGLDWQNEKSLLALNLADVILMFRNRKEKK